MRVCVAGCPRSCPCSTQALTLQTPQHTQTVCRWALRQQEKKAGGANGRQQDILDRILGGVDEREWGAAAVRQLRDEVRMWLSRLLLVRAGERGISVDALSL